MDVVAVAQAALAALGLEPDNPDWDLPLPALRPMSPREQLDWNLAWGREHLAPWLGRRIRRTSSGLGRAAKQGRYRTVSPRRASDNAAAPETRLAE